MHMSLETLLSPLPSIFTPQLPGLTSPQPNLNHFVIQTAKLSDEIASHLQVKCKTK
jgi:hypothetical protein